MHVLIVRHLKTINSRSNAKVVTAGLILQTTFKLAHYVRALSINGVIEITLGALVAVKV